VEISRITLEDISPQKAEITLPHRKGHNPITLPLPENTLKAIAAYLSRGRPRSPSRTLFVSLQFPYGPMHPTRLSQSISTAMRRAGLSATAYGLRHTYAQNLLQMGHSIYEIKEMLGHDRVQSTQRYLHIHVDLMREVLFHETL
jgi:site-specific recombinase XerD